MKTGAALILFIGVLAVSSSVQAKSECQEWQLHWRTFRQNYISPEGRVYADEASRSHSEGQVYSLFFALVANDPALFETILHWTQIHLAQGKLNERLPAWSWGRREDGTWGVLDDNSASDADLLLAYILGESSRLWHKPGHAALSKSVAHNILRDETRFLPGLGLLVLPGKTGFSGPPWKLNPSYYPAFALRRLAALQSPEWKKILESSYRLLAMAAPNGIEPDWVFYGDQGMYGQTKGSYDAIRTYLWAGMDHSTQGRAFTARVQPFFQLVDRLNHVPESVDPLSLHVEGIGSAGFQAALGSVMKKQGRKIGSPAVPSGASYYAQALSLFGTGYQATYAIGTSGELIPVWARKKTCL
ncbi:MAG: cellulose synthase complex periplasmic endoglucanase BcsZ [Thiobacillaceae bacterium]